MLFQLRHVDLVVGVGGGVIVLEVVGFGLLGDQRRHAFQQKIVVVRAPLHVVGLQFLHAKLLKRSDHRLQGLDHILSPAEREPCDLAGAGVDDRNSRSLIEFVAMRDRVSARAHHSLFLAREQNESDRALRPEAEAFSVRSASITSAALQPLSSAPVPNSHESRCAPRITNSSGFSFPRSSAMTFDAVIGPPILLGIVRSAQTGCPEPKSLPMRP